MAYASWSVVFGEQPSASKWNILGTNDASFNDGTGIAVSAITPEKLLTGTGTSWVWTSYTPTYTNLTTTSGTHTSKYARIGKTVIYRIGFTLGASSSVTGFIRASLPVTAASAKAEEPIGFGFIQDSGTAWYGAAARLTSTTEVDIAVQNAASTYLTVSGTSGTVPMTWTTNDGFYITAIYEAA